MSDHWCYCEAICEIGESMQLDPIESRHAAGAKRLAAGDAITLFDGRGRVAAATVVAVSARRPVIVRSEAIEKHDPPRPFITIASALPKGDRLATMLSMLTQLGVNRFIALKTERGIVRSPAAPPEKWRRWVIEACKQSRRAWLPELVGATTMDELIKSEAGESSVTLVAHPGGSTGGRAIREFVKDQMSDLTVIVGPEGGLTDDEVAVAMNHGGRVISLGDGVLRIETAAVSALAALRLLT